MNTQPERDYVLGTHQAELQRLGIQHRVWRPTVLDCWQRAGITVGSKVLDIGAGPGYATMDLAEIVGPTGQVVAVERSQRFLEAARAGCLQRGLTQVEFYELDLMNDPIPAQGMDATWCRWVACFVSSPRLLVEKIAKALRPGGVALFHEYINYAGWRLIPRDPLQEEFVELVMTSWRQNGGEPDIAQQLPTVLQDAGLTVTSAIPRVFCVRPCDYAWQWPASFIDSGLQRLVELKFLSSDQADATREQFQRAQADPRTMFITPTVLEMVARKLE